MTNPPALQRRLSTFDATSIGLASMLGAGVFVAFSPAARAAGDWLTLAIILAGAVAYFNARASAQLAAEYPNSGGTYVYARNRLGRWAGFVAGWSFVSGKTASCAAMAYTFALYVAPNFARPIAIAAVVLVTAVNLLGITKTALVSKILLVMTLVVLSFVIVVSFTGIPSAEAEVAPTGSALGVFQAAGFMFFAFAGYARIATLGEEVRNPRRTIPTAILLALAMAVVLYLTIGLGLLHRLGAAGIAASPTPLLEVVRGAGPAVVLVMIGAAAASLGALLALVAGVGRTTLAMAQNGDLPRFLGTISAKSSVPFAAELSVAVVVIALLLSTDVLTMVGFSSFGVLLYYALTNLSALTLTQRPWHAPRVLNVAGFVGCVALAATLPSRSIGVMVAVLAVGIVIRLVARLARRQSAV